MTLSFLALMAATALGLRHSAHSHVVAEGQRPDVLTMVDVERRDDDNYNQHAIHHSNMATIDLDATRLCAARGQFSVPEARPPPRARTTHRTTLSHLVHLLTAAPPALASRTCTR